MENMPSFGFTSFPCFPDTFIGGRRGDTHLKEFSVFPKETTPSPDGVSNTYAANPVNLFSMKALILFSYKNWSLSFLRSFKKHNIFSLTLLTFLIPQPEGMSNIIHFLPLVLQRLSCNIMRCTIIIIKIPGKQYGVIGMLAHNIICFVAIHFFITRANIFLAD